MSPGKELDVLIAEKVMGWKLHGDSKITSRTHGCKYVAPDGGYYHGPSEYSTDISAAWELVEFLRDSGQWCCLNLTSDYNYVYEFNLIKSSLNGNATHEITIRSGCCESASHAICLAALKAVGVSV